AFFFNYVRFCAVVALQPEYSSLILDTVNRIKSLTTQKPGLTRVSCWRNSQRLVSNTNDSALNAFNLKGD
ncbi:MAG TPA: hypothetical protein VFP87_12275, partial [Chitinophagaceae bacterium]|nr:hypothetical protein [Chitinophagaceae bacterium]